jgi:hypothetical protein
LSKAEANCSERAHCVSDTIYQLPNLLLLRLVETAHLVSPCLSIGVEVIIFYDLSIALARTIAATTGCEPVKLLPWRRLRSSGDDPLEPVVLIPFGIDPAAANRLQFGQTQGTHVIPFCSLGRRPEIDFTLCGAAVLSAASQPQIKLRGAHGK